jgi:hypothetical protein
MVIEYKVIKFNTHTPEYFLTFHHPPKRIWKRYKRIGYTVEYFLTFHHPPKRIWKR